MSTALGCRVELALDVVQHGVLEDQDRVRVLERRPSMPRASSIVAGRQHPDAGDVRVPALQAVRVLGGELAPAARRHADDQRHGELPARHVRDGGGVVHDLIEREQAEVAPS